MDNLHLLQTIKDLISEAELDKALDLLEKEWSGKLQYKTLLREVLSIGALYHKTKNDELKGIISFENAQLNYNRVNERLLNVLEHFENGQLEPKDLLTANESPSSKLKKWLWLWLLLLAVVVLLILKPQLLSGRKVSDSDPDFCPNFERAALKIMVLPFYKVNQQAGQPEGLFVENLESFCDKCKLNVSVVLAKNFQPDKLLNHNEAVSLAQRCNADLILWGRTEFAEGRNILKTRYGFAKGAPSNLQMSKLVWGENQFDTVRVLSDIAVDRTYTADLEEVIILAIGAHETLQNHPENAACLLSSFEAKDTQINVSKSMLLAENMIRTGNYENALMIYDEILAAKPDNWLALNNRGMILMKSENYLKAINDFSKVLQDKQDTSVLYARAKAYQMTDQLMKAKADYEQLIKISPTMASKVAPELETTREKIELEENVILKTQPRTGRQDYSSNYLTKVDAYSKLGQNQKAIQLIQKGLETQPLDPRLTAKKIELLLKQNNEEEARRELKAAQEKGISLEELSRHSNVVQQFIGDLENQKTKQNLTNQINRNFPIH